MKKILKTTLKVLATILIALLLSLIIVVINRPWGITDTEENYRAKYNGYNVGKEVPCTTYHWTLDLTTLTAFNEWESYHTYTCDWEGITTIIVPYENDTNLLNISQTICDKCEKLK